MTRTRTNPNEPEADRGHRPASRTTSLRPGADADGGRQDLAMRRTRIHTSQTGATVLEYAILLAVLAGVAVAAVGVLGTELDNMITTIAGKIPGLTAGIGST